MTAIFRDDADASARRETATKRLLSMCPASYRPIVAPFVEMAVANASDAELASLLVDVDSVVANAESGNLAAIADIAKKYGATDSMVAAYLPALQASA